MSRHAAPEEKRDRRKLLAALVAVVGIAVTAGGVYAGLNATAQNATAETVTSGTLKLVMADATGTTTFAQNISDMAPGDSVARYVDVTDNGTLAARNMTLGVTDGTPTKLTTDGTNGLHATVQSCPIAWAVV